MIYIENLRERGDWLGSGRLSVLALKAGKERESCKPRRKRSKDFNQGDS